MSDEAWAPGSQEPGVGGGELPPVNYEDGLSINQAFSLDTYLRNGMRLTSEQPALALIAGAAVFAVTFVSIVVQQVMGLAAPDVTQDQMGFALFQILTVGVSMVFTLLQTGVSAGAFVALSKYIATDEANVGTIFSAVGAMVRVILYQVLVMFLTWGVMIVGVAPGGGLIAYAVTSETPVLALGGAVLLIPALIAMVYVVLGTMLGTYAAAIDGLGPVAALSRSWEAAKGARGTLFILTFVLGLLSAAGMCLLGIGLVFVNAVSFAGGAAGWLLYSRGAAIQKAPFFERNPLNAS